MTKPKAMPLPNATSVVVFIAVILGTFAWWEWHLPQPPQRLLVRNVSPAECLAKPELQPQLGEANSCTLTGFVVKVDRPSCATDNNPAEAWGVSSKPHRKGQLAAFCLSQIVWFQPIHQPKAG